jgi:NAD(P)-dependent dehydrogenase (short-subunit alcohol dehydrogenase family)
MTTGSDLKDSVMDGDPDQWAKMMTLNLITPMRLTRALAASLSQRKGTIINMSSVAGLHASKGNPAYAASKWGMSGWSESSFEVRPALHLLLIVVCL